jgi:hypothetical protein
VIGLPGGWMGNIIFAGTPFTRWLGGGVCFLVAAGACVVVAAQFPSLLRAWWGYGHGRCPCGQWLREEDRVDGFPDPISLEDDSLWIAVWRCRKCQTLLHSTVSFGSFV